MIERLPVDDKLHSSQRRKNSGQGFTLIELQIAITIVGALAAIAVQSYHTYRDQADVDKAITDMRAIDPQIQLYRQVNQLYPSTLSLVPQADLLDPWGHQYQYLQIEGGDIKGKGEVRKDKSLVPINSDYDLYSMGADGKSVAPLTAAASQDDLFARTMALISGSPPTINPAKNPSPAICRQCFQQVADFDEAIEVSFFC